MVISSVNSYMPYRSKISFNAGNRKHYEQKGNLSLSQVSKNLRQIPVAFFISMIPIAADAQTPKIDTIPQSHAVEIVKQKKPERQEIVLSAGTDIIDNQKLKYSATSNDLNGSNYEKIYFQYSKEDYNKVSNLNGLLLAVCSEPNENGQYLVMFRRMEGSDLKNKFELCYMPEIFGETLYNLTVSNNNHNATELVDKDDFYEYFGEEAVNGASEIQDVPMRTFMTGY